MQGSRSSAMDSLAEQIERLLVMLEGTGRAPAVDPGHPAALRSQLAEHFAFTGPVDRADLLNAAAILLRATSAQGDHGLYFGSIAAGSRQATIAGEVMESGLGLLPVVWELAPGAAELQRLLLDHLVSKVGMDPKRTVAHVCENGEEASLSALIIAATQCFPEFEAEGARGLKTTPRLYCSEAIAGPWRKRAHAAGLGRDAVHPVPCDAAGRIEVGALRKAVREDAEAEQTPFLVVAGAGAASTGAIDPVKQLVAFCRVQGMWLHVDGSGFGLGVYTPRLAQQLDGSGFADSYSCETRGGLPAAGSAGFLLCRHPRPLGHAFAVDDPRMPAVTPGTSESLQAGLLGARRAAALPFLLWLAQLGQEGYAEALERLLQRADDLRQLLSAAKCKILGSIDVPVVCFLPPRVSGEKELGDLASQLRKRSLAWIDAVRLPDGAPCLRAWMSSTTTGPAELEALIGALRECDAME